MSTGKPQGFAAMDVEKQREVARRGGAAVPAEKRLFAKDRNLAAAAGKAGGLALPAESRTFSRDRELASQAGKLGGRRGREKAT